MFVAFLSLQMKISDVLVELLKLGTGCHLGLHSLNSGSPEFRV